MAARTVEVPIERLGRWVTNFAQRHDGAALLPAGLTSPALTQATTADDDAAAPGQVTALRLQGGDGEVAELRRWAGSTGIPGSEEHGDHHLDATTPAALAAIATWCAPPEHLGMVLIRRGGYAVGRAEGGHLRSHKSGTRYVQSRTAAGGWSQQRFARRRGNQADALVAVVADLTATHLLPAPVGTAPRLPQALVLGGDRALIQQVLADSQLAPLAGLPRRVFADLPEPRFAVLEQALQRGRSIPVQIVAAK